MATVVRADARRAARIAARSPSALVIAVGPASDARVPAARIAVSVKDRALSQRLTGAITRAVRAAAETPAEDEPVLRVRSRQALERLGAWIEGAIAVVPVRARSLRRTGELVEAVRAAGAAGVQLVWDGVDPAREIAEAPIFAILEQARATPAGAPVVLARDEEPVEALRILIAHRR